MFTSPLIHEEAAMEMARSLRSEWTRSNSNLTMPFRAQEGVITAYLQASQVAKYVLD